MRILNDNFIYDYNITTPNQIPDNNNNNSIDDFTIDFRYRKYNQSDTRKSFQISRTNQQFSTVMSDLLGEYDVPNNLKSDFASHFRFNLERLSRMRRGGITVAVTLKVSAINSERVEGIMSRINNRENENRVVRRVVDDTVEMISARKSAVAELERGSFNDDGIEKSEECSICLGTYVKGVEIIKMPCYHVYHTGCILTWLDKNHFCPFCRFELPC